MAIGTTAAILGSAAIGAGTGIASGIMGSKAAGNAAKQQAAAASEANRLQRDMFQQQRKDQAPWREAGASALGDLANPDFKRDFTSADFQKDPGYDFRMQEGQKALERSAAARGGLQSGGTLKALSRYGQDFASNEYNNAYNRFNADRDRRFNRLSSIAGLGQTANNQIGAAGQNYANQVGANQMGAANAAGAAGIASANAWGNSLSGIGNLGMQGLWMNQWRQQQQANPIAANMAGQPYKTLGPIV
jgi:hypothetical protein